MDARSRSPARPTIVYDAECPFCRAQIERIRRMDARGAFDYTPRQTAGLTDRFPVLASDELQSGLRLVTEDGRVLVGADSVHGIVSRLPGWRRLAWLYRLPGVRGACRLAYGRVSARRRSLAATCDAASCDGL